MSGDSVSRAGWYQGCEQVQVGMNGPAAAAGSLGAPLAVSYGAPAERALPSHLRPRVVRALRAARLLRARFSDHARVKQAQTRIWGRLDYLLEGMSRPGCGPRYTSRSAAARTALLMRE
ncbi:hypothetical protein O0L34_g3922 [Tuta absoluta]|nr:hypothetical protein O0L34_g3922 [Tuta absoluta]